MDDYAGRVLAGRYRLPLPPSDEYELAETRAFDTYSGQEVLVRQVPLPEVVDAEVVDAEGPSGGFAARDGGPRGAARRAPEPYAGTGPSADPVVRRAMDAAQAAAAVPDHPRLDQVFDVFPESGSLWIVSELVAARPLAALLAEEPLTPYRAAEVAADVLMALRVLHGYGWVHRNITARTVLVCDDGRVVLTGLAVGAAEEALCGYDPVPAREDDGDEGAEAHGEPYGTEPYGMEPYGPEPYGPDLESPYDPDPGEDPYGTGETAAPYGTDHGAAAPYGEAPYGDGRGADPYGRAGAAPVGHPPGPEPVPGQHAVGPGAAADPEAARRAAIRAREEGLPAFGQGGPAGLPPAASDTGADIRAARAGAIAAYREGARAAARVQEARDGRAALPGGPLPDGFRARPALEGAPEHPYGDLPAAASGHAAPEGPAALDASGGPDAQETAPLGRIADPYGVRSASWHGATPRTPDPAGLGGPPAVAAPPSAGVPAVASSGAPSAPAAPAAAGGWDGPEARVPAPRGPATALAAERARQARMAVVGPVTERWAPEQAGPVHENWQLAAPIGPATDLWALGALLFRAVQGHAPYPEDSTAELVQIVCSEPPAFAEECGPLRPVVESLLRQDPTERIDFEELNGWLRSLVRSAPEPDAGLYVVPAPPADTARLPVVRRRGELVRRRRGGGQLAQQARHKRGREEERSPRSLGRTLLLVILLALAGAVAYAMFFMPRNEAEGPGRAGSAPAESRVPAEPPARSPQASGDPRPEETSSGSEPDSAGTAAGSAETQTTGPGAADGFTLRTDPEGFRVAVARGWTRIPRNSSGQVVYRKGDFELVVVPGRDGTGEYGEDPMVYQREGERELAPYRSSTWATSSGLRTIEVGGRTMAEGEFTWTGSRGGELYVRNVAILIDGRYHVVQVRGPVTRRDEVTRLYEQASGTYRYTR
ncbi:protein kinase [Streptomyces sp. SHP 1-2]|uniref:protein kinase n=1 Tax=Streptomyces sp. SHP 1-2 TaxID=2769489 RepID=UPI00223874B5|nr:protein kinase [Streptomyces sp. SHP 1-2]MCW5251550.1 protein kinase [Streptomyces sp. SHP 1-2]